RRPAGVRDRLRRRIHLGISLRALAHPLREPPRLRAVRVVSHRLRPHRPLHGVERHRLVGLNAWLGPLFAVLGVLGFSFEEILFKLACAAAPVDPVSLMTLRMLYSAPFFVAIAWWAGRARGAAPIGRRDGWLLLGLGFIGYYLSSLLDFLGLQYVTASLERLVLFLYPTIVVLLSALFLSHP